MEKKIPTLKQWRIESERIYLRRVMQESNGDVHAAAKTCGITHQGLYLALARVGLNPDDFKPAPKVMKVDIWPEKV